MWVALAFGGSPVITTPEAVNVSSVDLDEGPMAVHLAGVTATSIRRDGVRIGFLLDGAGTATVRFADEGDAIAFADRQVLWFGQPKEAMAPIAHLEKPYTDKIRRVIVLSGD